MAETTLDNLVLRSASVVSLNDRFSKVLEVPGQVLSEVKREPLVEDLCCDLEFRTVLLRKRLARVGPRGPRGLRPQRLSLDSGPPGGRPLSSAALEGRFLGGRRCPCALWGLRLLSRRYGWAGKVLRARPLERAGFNPNGGVRDPGPTSTTAPIPGQTNAWQHAPKQGWKPQFKRKVPTKEQLDQQLDDYMAMSKKHLDAQLDAYMAMAGDLDEEDDRKWYDIDCA